MQFLELFAVALLLTCMGSAVADTNTPHDGQHDFDYLVGSWNIHL